MAGETEIFGVRLFLERFRNGRILLPIPMEKLYFPRPIALSRCGMEKESEGDHRVGRDE
jgi:hypothetical protein